MTVDTEFQDDLVNERIQIAQQALSAFQELVGKEQVSAVERDAAIQRFEYTFEAVWKAAQRYLLIREVSMPDHQKQSFAPAGRVVSWMRL